MRLTIRQEVEINRQASRIVENVLLGALRKMKEEEDLRNMLAEINEYSERTNANEDAANTTEKQNKLAIEPNLQEDKGNQPEVKAENQDHSYEDDDEIKKMLDDLEEMCEKSIIKETIISCKTTKDTARREINSISSDIADTQNGIILKNTVRPLEEISKDYNIPQIGDTLKNTVYHDIKDTPKDKEIHNIIDTMRQETEKENNGMAKVDNNNSIPLNGNTTVIASDDIREWNLPNEHMKEQTESTISTDDKKKWRIFPGFHGRRGEKKRENLEKFKTEEKKSRSTIRNRLASIFCCGKTEE